MMSEAGNGDLELLTDARRRLAGLFDELKRQEAELRRAGTAEVGRALLGETIDSAGRLLQSMERAVASSGGKINGPDYDAKQS